MRWSQISCLLVAGACFGAGMVSANAAAWGSIHGNNRSAIISRGGGSFRSPSVNPARGREEEGEHRVQARPELGNRPVDRERDGRIGREGHRENEFWEHRHLDFDGDRRRSYFWYDYTPGMIIGTLPSDYSQIYVGGVPYFYDQGVYYQQNPAGYVVVKPPLGAVVAQVPPGAEALPVNGTIYYYAAGTFYVQQPQGFVVVPPPLGITVTELPPGATPVTLNGVVYYQADGVYFQPMMQNGVTVFMTVRPLG